MGFARGNSSPPLLPPAPVTSLIRDYCRRQPCWIPGFLRVGFLCLALATPAAAAPAHVLQAYRDTQTRHQVQLDNPKLAWEYGRACFDLAEYATNNTERADLAEQGIATCRQALAHDTKSAPAHYYLGLNLGQLARTRGLSALKLIKEMENAWLIAAELDNRLDHAGPERCLGMLYRDAPALVSVGSHTKARHQLSRAVELAPNYPENRLELIEGYLKWNDRPAARRELRALEQTLPAAREDLKGPTWAASWAEWNARLEKLGKTAEEPSKMETPRH